MKCFDVLKSHLAPLLTIFFYILSVADSQSVYYTNYYNNGYEVRDLIKTGTCFTAYADMWGYSEIQSALPYIYCSDGYYILGGLNVLGPPSTSVQTGAYWSRSYVSLPTHNVIYFSLTLYIQLSWDAVDYVQINFGGTTLTVLLGVVNTRYYEATYCPTGQAIIRNIRIFGSVQHIPTTLNLYVISMANENNANEAFGIREFNTMYVQTASPPANTVCNTGPDGVTTSLQCTCSEGYYYTGSTCVACDSNCASCYGAGASACYQCKPGSSLIGTACVACYSGCNFCTGTGYNECIECARDFFLLNGNQCVSKCDPPLVQGTTANGCVNTCSTPCTTTTDFVYWDGACNATCPSPLVTSNLNGVINYCRWPCADGQFLLWNGVCVNTCPKPFIPVAQNGQQFCTTPCTTGEWLYWDESCGTECNFPLNQNDYNGQMLCEYLCSSTTYLYWNGSCISTCPSPLQNRTFKGYEFCDFPLDDTRLYLYFDGTSDDTCDLPLWAQAQGSPMIRYFCYYPCQPTQYLYTNGTCASFCYYPLSIRNQNGWLFCDNPCPDTVNDFLWWNGTCRTDCNSPYLQRIEPGTNYCDFPCTASQYLYWDNTCMPTCAGPLQNYTASLEPMQFCNYTCLVTEYSYWNNTCGTSCDFPLVSQTYKSRMFCEYPCGRSQYLFYNGTCSDNCLLPYVHRRENGYGYCEYPCSDSEYLFWDGQCLANCDSPLIYQAGSYGEKYCFTPCMDPLEYYIVETGQCVESCDEDSRVQGELWLRCLWPPVPEDNGLIGLLLVIQGYSGTTSLLAPVKLSQHIRYLDVNQPPRLKKFSLSEARSILTPKFGIPKPSDLESWFVSVSIPDQYDGQPLYSSFFMNYWDAMTTIFSVMFVGLFIAAISYMVKADDNMVNYAIMDKLKTVFIWNFCLVLFVLNIDEALLYISIDFRSAKLNNGSATFSIFMCLLWILLVVIFVLTSHYVLKKRHRIKKQALESEEFEGLVQFGRRWEGWQVVFRGFRDNTHFNRYFYLLYITRVAFPVFVSALFIRWPITQTTLHVVTSVFIVCYIVLANPLKRAVNYIQLLLLETLILVVNISAFLMAVFDRMDSVGDRAYVLLGDIIIMANFFYNVIVIVFLPIKLALEAYYLYKFELSQEKKNPSNWVRLLVVPVQQCAFGFEEVLRQVYNPDEDREHDSAKNTQVITENINNFKRPVSEDETSPVGFEVINFEKPTFGKRGRRLKADGSLRSSQPVAIAEEDETDSIPKRSPRMPTMLENSFSPMMMRRQSELSFDHQMTPAGQPLVSPLDLSRAMFLENNNDNELARDSVVLRGFDTYGEEYQSPRIGERGYSPERNHGVKGSVMVSHAPNTPTYAQRKPHNLFSNRQRRSNAAMRGGSIPSIAHDMQDDYRMDKVVNDDW